jgi:hypothetical protein
VVFSKKGDNILFVQAEKGKDSHLLSIQEGLSKFHATEDEVSATISNEFPDLFNIASAKLDEKHPLPEIRGRRSDAIKLLEALMMSLPGAQGYCADLIKVISKYDDVSEGALKDIAQSNFTDVEKCLVSIKRIVPESFVRNVLERIQRMEDEADMILLAEEFSS